jgi:hypothetical protein
MIWNQNPIAWKEGNIAEFKAKKLWSEEWLHSTRNRPTHVLWISVEALCIHTELDPDAQEGR